MNREPSVASAGEWLSLKQAAVLLHVHQATLRRWADAGEMPHWVTPGGHRRFRRDDLHAFAAAHSVQAHATPMPEAWATRAVEQARSELPAQAGAHWMQMMNAHTREQHRAIGRKLMALTLQYVSAEDEAGATHLLDEARDVGREYAAANLSAGVSLTDSMQAAMFFRDRLLDASLELPDSARPRHSDQRRLLKRINTLLGVVQLALAEVYEQAPARKQRAAKPAMPAANNKKAGAAKTARGAK